MLYTQRIKSTDKCNGFFSSLKNKRLKTDLRISVKTSQKRGPHIKRRLFHFGIIHTW